MDVKYMNPFIMAAQTVFKTMLNLDVALNKPMLKTTKATSAEITGFVGLGGDKKGIVAISFREKGALFVYKTLMGEDVPKICPEVIDAVGELTNIISGQARKELANTGLNLQASIPTVVVGKDVEINIITQIPIISLPFSFAAGNGESETMFLDFSFE